MNPHESTCWRNVLFYVIRYEHAYICTVYIIHIHIYNIYITYNVLTQPKDHEIKV